MVMNRVTHERRQHERYRIKDDHMAYVAVRPKFSQIGRMKDISWGGLCFEYLLLNEIEPFTAHESAVSIDIFIREKGFYLQGVKCRPAYDINWEDNDSSTPFNVVAKRKCGLKFDELTEKQKNQIDVFMKLYTEGTA